MKVSVIVIALNEEARIAGCLESIRWADEIIVVDTGSSDGTVDICKKYTDKISQSEWLGFGPLKDFAVSKTSNEWVLNIDADERVSDELRDEILALSSNPAIAAYNIPFHNFFMNRRLRFGGLGGEKHIRLFNKNTAGFGAEAVHESVAVRGRTGKLKGHIEHRSYRDLSAYFQKFNLYTSMIAREKFQKGKKFPVSAFFRIPYEFGVRYFFKLGFLDGVAGFIYASISAFYAGVKYFKLYELTTGLKE
ncbi:glycosyltransferase family 2 protein [bacterium]|nr:glycosyltransferase family 2 protein [Candidatus Omnitrophota bacterium]MBA3066165.1 glycosyltransferase family 2 protein [bacterium]MBU2529269.1 glycosyltransferase family 2 protein [bacterium]MBU3930240.1 glycosyltransferase family 2 protein [bacterium]MBU4122094.1 glycosyltransferase family 2 protein [bacterium]